MGKAPAFQFYAADFLTGTSEMTSSEIGIYIRLLASSWDKGPLPSEHARLARIVAEPLEAFEAAWVTVGKKWLLTDDGYINERLETQRAEREEFAARQAARGRRSGDARRTGSERPRSSPVEPRPVEPEGNQGPLNSSVFSLQSSEEREDARDEEPVSPSPPSWGQGRKGARGGLVDNHPQCDPSTRAACNRSFCVPPFHVRAWRGQIDPDSQRHAETDALIRRVVEAGLKKLPASGGIGATAKKFWDDHWTEWHASNAPKSTKPDTRGPHVPDIDATRAYIDSIHGTRQ